MPVFRPLLAALVGIIAGFAITAALADEAYLCADGSVVYVEFGKLAEMKRTNACVAAHYGLKIEPVSATPAPAGTEAKGDRTKEPATPRLQTFSAADELAVTHRPTRQAALRPVPPPAPNTDFRWVKLINAPSGEDAWFHHQR